MSSQKEVVIKVINLPVHSMPLCQSSSFLDVNYRTDYLLLKSRVEKNESAVRKNDLLL